MQDIQGKGSEQQSPKRWFITGASGGLGRHLVEVALSKGDEVIATARRTDALQELADASRGHLWVEELDVTRKEDVERTIAQNLAAHGRIDVVVNNAGYGLIGAAEEMTNEQVQDQIATLLLAPIQITRAFLTPMREQGGGRIIQISSFGGQVAFPANSAYHAAKWGLEGFTECVNQEVAEFGIHLTLVEPGAIRTGFGSNLRFTRKAPPYEHTTVGQVRQLMEAGGNELYTGDPVKLAHAIFDTTRLPKPPIRLTLGADAYDQIHYALQSRLDALEAQQDLARSMAFD
jgi:NAD(P)-dependent dehydrogenase (short-subunit alcohol dehydrogenase family)